MSKELKYAPDQSPFGREIFAGRWTGDTHEPFVVFILGMRVNKFWQFAKWFFVSRSMRQMMNELTTDPKKGYLGGETFLYWRGVMQIQYWRTFDELEAYGRERGGIHAEAWRDFNKKIGADGTVGIWHETYMIEPAKYEAVYGNMPRFGLAKVSDHIPATGKLETARRRLGGENNPLYEPPETPEPELEEAIK